MIIEFFPMWGMNLQAFVRFYFDRHASKNEYKIIIIIKEIQ